MKAKKGEWSVLLTPCKAVPKSWFCELKGAKLLGLASGGGQQMPFFSALGADCTVMDYSDKQLENECIVATREGYHINIVKADMTKVFPFADCTFDIIFHPVSNCYIEDVIHVWYRLVFQFPYTALMSTSSFRMSPFDFQVPPTPWGCVY